jgi:hypothetical protein
MLALGRYLRAAVLPALPGDAVVVIAGRRPPEPAWFTDGWEHVVDVIALDELAPEEARRLLELHGVADAGEATAILRWSGGSPLALALAGDAGVSSVAPSVADGPLVDRLVRNLVDAAIDPGQRAVVGVAAIARVTTAELLAAVLPDRDAERDLAWLAGRTFADPHGTGVRLHELTGRAVRASLRNHDPIAEHDLRRRIAEHLHARALDGHLELTIDLAHLVDDPLIRWGYGWDGSERHRVDDVRPGDATIVSEALEARGRAAWWSGTERWFAEAPERIFVVRDAEERLCGYATAISPANAPDFAHTDALVGPWLAHAARAGGEAVIWRDSVDFTRDPPVQAMLGLAGILRSGERNPRYAYLPIDARMPSAVAFADALGATHLPELDPPRAGSPLQCRRIDYGPGGLLGAQLAVVHREVGFRPTLDARPALVTFDVVRDALRDLRVPHRLALSPLAVGDDTPARAASVAEQLARAAEEAFGTTDDERQLHAVLVRGYLDPAPSHELAADELHFSRSAYFRRLRSATLRLAEHLSR